MAIRRRPIYLFPTPKRAEWGDGSIHLGDSWALSCETPKAAGLIESYRTVLGIPVGGAERRIRLVEARLGEEAYRIEIEPQEARIAAQTEAGFRYALQTLQQIHIGGHLPVGTIEDAPALPMRGFHVYLHRQFNYEAVRRLIESAARFKLNTLVLEYANRFPHTQHACINAPDAFSREEVVELVGLAQRLGMNVIPLQQSLGHLEYVLHHDAYSAVREEETVRAQMCPSNPASFDLFVSLAEEVLALHPGARFLHVGGDETRQLGVCPKCHERAQRIGLGGLYGEHMQKVLQWTLDQGLRPILWDDMICAHPEALDYLPRETLIMYWEYWTVHNPSPYFVARFQRRGKPAIVCDARWGQEWPLESLPEVQRRVMQRFARGVPLEQDLGAEFLQRYGPYLGRDFPKFIRAFPYLEYYQDQGFEVIAGPTALGNHEWLFGLPHFHRFFHNIHAFSQRCKENGKALGVVTTSWYGFPTEFLQQGLVATGQFAWSRE